MAEIFSTDQGSEFTACQFTDVLKENGIRISMNGKGRASDHIFVERLWRTIKYEYNLRYQNSDINGTMARYYHNTELPDGLTINL